MREWSRGPQWVSPEARAKYEPMIERASRAWSEIEILSVSSGLRGSALLFLQADELAEAQLACRANGLDLTVVEATGSRLRVAVHKVGLAGEWSQAWREGDDDTIGWLLGFPRCCREFFEREWDARGSRDVVPYMGAVDGPWEANILLRHLGVRLVPFLPCGGACEDSVDLARRFLLAGQDGGVEVEAIEELLRLPVSYDLQNGLAIVSTPYFRLAVGADPGDAFSATRISRVQASRPSCTPPERAGATGSTAIKEQKQIAPASSQASDNGFASLEAMQDAHAVILDVLGPVDSLLDLGSGDGALLARAHGGRPSLSPRWTGIEFNGSRVVAGRRRHPGLHLRHGTIAGVLQDLQSGAYAAATLMPGRLLELPEGRRGSVLEHLWRVADRVIVYAYGDWIDKYDNGLVGLASAAGLRIKCGSLRSGEGVQAAEVQA